MGNPSLHLSHIKRTSNRVVDTLKNEGVGKFISFHVEDINGVKDGMIWRGYEELLENDIGRTVADHPQ